MPPKPMTVNEIRRHFLAFFEKKDHKIFPSDSLVPQSDPTLLFTGAGMNQFKEYFLGKKKELRRAASCQKCLRTGDLDNVGHTPSHHTFFEMLGNFSFGDYFKKEAIAWAWEFMTRELGIPPDSLAVSVYQEDREAYDIWLKTIRVPEERIFKFGPKENFWPSNVQAEGPNGPCGPCSEIFYDWDPKNPDASYDDRRFTEVWNLVFTQYDRQGDGSLKDLPAKNIDTGMGLERMAAVMQGVRTNFEMDVFQELVAFILKEAGLSGGEREKRAWVNRIADHARAVSFAVLDGVMPSNKERGYVVRTLIRRASFSAKTLGIKTPFLHNMVPLVAEAMREPYPDLLESRQRVSRVVLTEEESFEKTLEQGLLTEESLLEEQLQKGKKSLPGKDIFYLYDTLGLPLDLIRYAAERKGVALDETAFQEELEAQRTRSKKGSQMKGDIFGADAMKKMHIDLKTEFVGYQTCRVEEAKIIAIFRDGERAEEVREGDAVEIFMDRSPFYGEQGGQVGDTGILESETAHIRVEDTQHLGEALVHRGKVEKGRLHSGQNVQAVVDEARRRSIMKNHTATHLLHSALREVLGTHVQQAGSWVGPEGLRFDFMHSKPMTPEEVRQVEERVNEHIFRDDPVEPKEMSRGDSRKEGAIAFFGEKYGENVRVLRISDYSKELCGGTHAARTGDVGLFWILRESSIGSGTRRMEALTGSEASRKLTSDAEKIYQMAAALKILDGHSAENEKRRFEALETFPKYREAKAYRETMREAASVLKVPEDKVMDAVQEMQRETKSEAQRPPLLKEGMGMESLKQEILARIRHLQNQLKKVKQESSGKKKEQINRVVDEMEKRKETFGDIVFYYYADASSFYRKEDFPIAIDILRAQRSGSWIAVLKGEDDDGKPFYVVGSDGTVGARAALSKIAEITGSQGGGTDRLAKGGGGDSQKWPSAVDAVKKLIEEKVR
ncbi:MAG: alanine--tRNA ligase [Candidatus Omnitrophota bacterium]